jgi:GntP family gluconate:H+ symporter
MNIWWIVILSVIVVLGAILVCRLHAFLTLLLAGLLVAALSSTDALRDYAQDQVADGKMAAKAAEKFPDLPAPTRLAAEFGQTAGKIGILIALASIIGQCLLESGAAATIVDRMLKITGPRLAPEALAASSFVLGIPVFFDTVFYLMVPLARSLRRRVGKNYVLFILAILAGGSIAHSLIPPTPGPLIVAEKLKIDIGVMLLAGLSIGACSSIVSLLAARTINYFVDVPLRLDDEAEAAEAAEPGSEHFPSTTSSQGRPGLIESLLPIVIPVVLISSASMISYFVDAKSIEASSLTRLVELIGEKNIAIAVGVVFAMALLRYCPVEKRPALISRSLASAGNIILITAAGGAFGGMLRQAGIADAISGLTGGVPGLTLLVIAFAVTASIRTLQGSATVAMITAAGVLQGFAEVESLPFHPVYLAMAIGAGSKPVSWMTDSAFWVITRMSGMTEAEGLRVISPMSISMGFSALAFTLLFAYLFPAI